MTRCLDRTPLRNWLQAAVLTPSSQNTRPWLFDLTGRRLRLSADRTWALPANDPGDREVSCGFALTNLHVAAAADNRSLARARAAPDKA